MRKSASLVIPKPFPRLTDKAARPCAVIDRSAHKLPLHNETRHHIHTPAISGLCRPRQPVERSQTPIHRFPHSMGEPKEIHDGALENATDEWKSEAPYKARV